MVEKFPRQPKLGTGMPPVSGLEKLKPQILSFWEFEREYLTPKPNRSYLWTILNKFGQTLFS